MGEYELTKEKILAIVKECPQAEKPLKAAFPEAFKEKWVVVDPGRITAKVSLGYNGMFRVIVMIDGIAVGEIRKSGIHITSDRHRNNESLMALFSIYEKK